MSIDDLKFRTKSMIPLIVIAIAVCVMVGFNARQSTEFSRAASDVIEHRDVAVTKLVRATRLATLIPYSILGSLVYDSDKPEGQAAKKMYENDRRSGEQLRAGSYAGPRQGGGHRAVRIAIEDERFGRAVETPVSRIGDETPGLAKRQQAGPKRSEGDGAKARLTGDVDLKFRTLVQASAR